MSSDPRLGTSQADPAGPRHVRRIVLIWLVLSVIAVLAVVLLWGPHLPPGDETVQAHHQQTINTLLGAMVTPVIVGILVYGIYSLIAFRRGGARATDGADDAGPPLRGDRRITTAWLSVTLAIVLTGTIYGTFDWIGPGFGSGSAQGPDPLSRPPGRPLEVQVIGQQWLWTFRYPTYGGVETTDLLIPADRYIEFHVTSLDVIHSFWAIKLGIKADAVPGADNIVYVEAGGPRPFSIRCAELCGLWHGQMYNLTSKVVSPERFAQWIAEQRRATRDIQPFLPPYAHTYHPGPEYRAS